mgnify:CR=1 FL=1
MRSIPNKGLGFGALAHLADNPTQAILSRLPVPQLTFNYLGQFDASFSEAQGALFLPASEGAGDELNAQAPLSNVLDVFRASVAMPSPNRLQPPIEREPTWTSPDYAAA